MLKKKLTNRRSSQRGASGRRTPRSPFEPPVSRQVLEKLVAGIADLRDRAIILFLMDTGARVSELVLQNRNMIKVRAGVLGGSFKFAATGTLSTAKSNGRRDVYISTRALEALNHYLESRQDANPALFATRSGERMRTEQVRRLLHTWCDRLGIERFPAHDFRRSLAESLVGAGSPYVIASVLGYPEMIDVQLESNRSRTRPARAASKSILGILQKLIDEVGTIIIAIGKQHLADSRDIGTISLPIVSADRFIIRRHCVTPPACC